MNFYYDENLNRIETKIKMSQSVVKLLKRFCKITQTDYKTGKVIYAIMNKNEKTQMVVAMKKIVAREKAKETITLVKSSRENGREGV